MNTEKLMLYEQQKVNPSTIWLLFLFFGWSYGSLDKIGLQIFFYLTLGGLGLWAFIRLFTLSDAIKEHNRVIASRLGFNNQELASLNVL